MINPRYLKKAFDDIFVSRARYIDRPSPVERYFFRKPREDGSPSKEGYYRDVPREERLFYLPELIDRTADGNFGARRVLDAVRKEWGEWHRPPVAPRSSVGRWCRLALPERHRGPGPLEPVQKRWWQP
jgi:hypothetical protein